MEKTELHEFRKQIDANIQRAESVIEAENTTETYKYIREMALARTKLQEAKMWVGKCLEKSGSELPAEYADNAEETA